MGRAREYLQRSGVLGVEGKDVSYAYFNGRPLRAFPATQPRSEPPPEQESATIGTSPTDIVF